MILWRITPDRICKALAEKAGGCWFRFQQSGGSDIVWISKKEILELSEGIQKAIEGESFDPRDEKEGP